MRHVSLIDSPAFAREFADFVDAYVGQLAWRDANERKACDAARGQWQVENAAAMISF